MFFFLIKVENSEWTRTEFHRWAFHSKTRVSTLGMNNYIMPWQVHMSPNHQDTKEGTLTTFLALNLAGFFCHLYINCRSNRLQCLMYFYQQCSFLCYVFWFLPRTVTNVFCLMFSSTRDTFIPELHVLSISKFLL